MLNITKHDFSERKFSSWELPNDYHATYILENGTHAYIGESQDVRNRARQHDVDAIKRQFKLKTMYVITHDDFDETPAKHCERILIKLMRADGTFKILNKNDGEKTHYARKKFFEKEFDTLWPTLVNLGLVKEKQFSLVLSSNIYKYSPYTAMSKEQQNAMNNIVNVLITGEAHRQFSGHKERPILVNGDAGTGKTVVATSLYYYLKSDERFGNSKIALVIPNPSMRHEMQEVFKRVNGLSKKDVKSPADITRDKYGIIICDEAHKLRNITNQISYKKHFVSACQRVALNHLTCDELDWIFAQSESCILFCDNKQAVSPAELKTSYFEKRINDRGVRSIELTRQQRVKAGRGYVPYVYNILYQKTSVKKNFKNYEFKMFSSFSDMHKKLFDKNDEIGLARLCTGYPWKYVSKQNESLYDIVIDGIKIKWNRKTSGWVSDSNCANEMGSIYSLAGIDLNYSGVVIGPDLYFDKQENKVKARLSSYFDNTVKKGVNPETIRTYLLNTYAVLLTRAIEGTYVYVYDGALREYLCKFIDIAD